MTVRTRIAPSPTGDPHVGTAYIALFNLAFARSKGGRFLLRIEDTDQVRSTETAERTILDALRWAGLDWDEGPDIGGDFGPYRQSERRDIYAQYAEALIKDGHAFHCFCSKERLEEVRKAQQANGETPRYDGHCRTLTEAEVQSRIDRGDDFVIRLVVPEEGTCSFDDGLRGSVEIPWQQVDMQVLVKTDGYPTYHLAVVVDDHLMEISHVLRGEEWISSMPKHVLLYRYFGWDMPRHYHLPLLRNPDKSKLSKRKNPTGINYYRALGFMPEALVNYLAMMGWSMPDEREKFSLAEMIEHFDVDRVSPRGPVFDLDKLKWLNGQYLRDLDPAEFERRALKWMLGNDRFTRIVPLVRERTEYFGELLPQLDYMLGDRAPLTAESFEAATTPEAALRILHHAQCCLDDTHDWQRDVLFTRLKALAEAMELKLRDFLPPLFIALSGRTSALPLFDSMEILGPDVTRARIRSALTALGGIGKKAAARHQREYRSFDL